MKWDRSEFREDVALGMSTAGLPELYHLYEAIYDGDTDAVKYHLAVAGTSHLIWFDAWLIHNAYDIMVKGGRNVMPFHRTMQGTSAMRGIIGKTLAAPLGIPGMVLYGVYKAGTSEQVKASRSHAAKHSYAPSRYRYAASKGAWKKTLRDN